MRITVGGNPGDDCENDCHKAEDISGAWVGPVFGTPDVHERRR